MQPLHGIRQSQKSVEDNTGRPGFNAALSLETQHVLQSALFRQSPTLSKLLTWLLEETQAGRGDEIKSYTIAVAALGRAENFDSQLDSYPRVQIGRLRKALESHYAQNGPVGDQCIYIRPGSYRLRFARLDHAYPHLHGPLTRTDGFAVAGDCSEIETISVPRRLPYLRRFLQMRMVQTILLVTALIALGLSWVIVTRG